MSAIQRFFEQRLKPPADGDTEAQEPALRLATAALLIEISRADYDISDDELDIVAKSLEATFDIPHTQIETLIELASHKVNDSTSLYEFTSLINKGFSREQKIKLMERLWKVAYADAQIEKYEQHLLSKLCRLLYISHKDYIAAKFRARAGIE